MSERRYNSWHHAMLYFCSKTDIVYWNEWRDAHPDIKIELEGANLQKAFLSEANLKKTNLHVVNLQKADLSRANLQKADLSGVNLQKANLRDANIQKAVLRDANIQKAVLRWANLQEAFLIYANLQEADLNRANLQKADLSGVNLQKADLSGVNLQKANLREAYLQEADLSMANLQNANLSGTYLQCAKFKIAHVDGMTVFSGCAFNLETDLSGVGLDGCTIDPELKSALKDNVRRIRWQNWFWQGNFFNIIFKNMLVRPFWWATNYGSSTARIVYIFFGLAALFAGVYFAFATITGLESIVNGLSLVGHSYWHVAWRSLYFSIVTMTTLGFGDMYAVERADVYGLLGCLFLSLQVMAGYVLLGALVTRLGILFTSEAPAAKPTEGIDK